MRGLWAETNIELVKEVSMGNPGALRVIDELMWFTDWHKMMLWCKNNLAAATPCPAPGSLIICGLGYPRRKDGLIRRAPNKSSPDHFDMGMQTPKAGMAELLNGYDFRGRFSNPDKSNRE